MKHKSQVVLQHDQTIWQMLEESQACFDAAPIGLAVLDAEARFLRINQKLADLNGIPVAAHIGRTIRELLSSVVADAAEAMIRKIVKTGKPVSDVELTTGKKANQPGATRHWLEQWVPVKDSNGSVMAINVVVEEITARKKVEEALRRLNSELDRKVTERTAKLTNAVTALRREVAERRQAEERLRQSQDQFRLLGATAPIGIYTADASGLSFCNNQFLELCGLSEKKVLGRGYLEVVHPDDRRLANSFRDHLGREIDIEHRIIVKGDVKWVRVRAKPLSDKSGKVVGRIGTVEDVTSHKEAELLLKLQRDLAVSLTRPGQFVETLSRILEAGCQVEGIDSGGIYISDPETGGVNLVCHRGVSSRFVRKVMRFEADSQQVRALMRGVKMYVDRAGVLQRSHMKQEGFRSFAVMPVTHGGKIVASLNLGSHSLSAIPPKAQKIIETIAVLIGPAITRLKDKAALQLSERSLRTLVSELALAEENERRRIAYGLHDDISQILVMAKLKLEGTISSHNPEEVRGTLREVSNCLAQVLQETRSLTFDLASPVLQRFGLEAAVVDLCHKMEARHSPSFIVRNDGKPKPLSSATEIMIFHAVRELLRNSVKHAKASRVTVSLRRAGMNLVVAVQDNGMGFDPSKSVGLTSKGGFGLYAIQERTTYLGGTFAVKKISPRGVCVVLTVPLSGTKARPA